MLNWYDLENRADSVLEEIALAEVTARNIEAAGEDNEATTIRRKLADAFISLGAKIDREALEKQVTQLREKFGDLRDAMQAQP